MANAGTISVTLKAVTDSFSKGMTAAADQMKGWEKAAKETAKVSTAAFVGLSAGIFLAVKEANAAEAAQVRLAAASRASGTAMDPDRMNRFASAMENVTKFSDDTVVSSAAVLASFKLTQDQIEQLLPKVADLAEFMGVPLEQAANMVGRSVASGTNALQRMGVVMTDTQEKAFKAASEQQRLAMMMDLLKGKAGGLAEAMAQTDEGAMTQFQNTIGNLAEEIGNLLKGPLGALARDGSAILKDIIGRIKAMSPEMKTWAGRAVLMATAAAGIASGVSALAVAFSTLGPILASALSPILPFTAALLALLAVIAQLRTVSKMGGFSVLAGMKEATAEQLQFVKEFQERSGGTLGGTIKESILGPLREVMDSIAPEFAKYEFKEPTAKPTGAGGGGGADAFTKGGLDFENFGGETFAQTLNAAGNMIDTGAQSFLDATDKMQDEMDKAAGPKKSLRQVADEAFTDVQVAMLDASSELVKDLGTGELTFKGQVYNAFAKSGDKVAMFMANAADILGAQVGKVIGNLGELGGLISSAQQGFEAGGPIGAVAAVVTDLLMKTKAFADIVATLNAGVGDVVKGLEPLMQGLFPVIRIVSTALSQLGQMLGQLFRGIGPLLTVITTMLVPLFKFFEPQLQALYLVISGVSLTLLYITKGIAQVWNGILGAIAYVFDKLGNIEIDLPGLSPIKPFGFMNDWADSVRDGKISMTGLNNAIDDVLNNEFDNSLNNIVDSQEAAAEAADKLTESLLNVPAGYKVALARFEAMDAVTSVPAAAYNMPASGEEGDGGNGRQIIIQQAVFNGAQAQEVYHELKRIMSLEEFLQGSSNTKQYATPRSR